MAANAALQPVRSRGWRMGFDNLLRKEFSLWWSTHRWWKQLLLWLLVTNAIPALVGYGVSQEGTPSGHSMTEMLSQIYFTLASLSLPIGAILAVQDAIIGERQSGTAEWILSKPISRRAFVLAKLVGHGLSFLALAVVVPCAAAYGQISAWAGEALPLLPFLMLSGLAALNALFYLAMAIMLGTWFNVRSAVSGSAIGFLFAGSILPSFFPWMARFTPWNLIEIGLKWVSQGSLPPELWQPLLFSLVWLAAFVIVALARFEREEI